MGGLSDLERSNSRFSAVPTVFKITFSLWKCLCANDLKNISPVAFSFSENISSDMEIEPFNCEKKMSQVKGGGGESEILAK